MRYLTAILTAGAFLAAAASAQAQDPKANRGPLRSAITTKALGPAEVVEGPVAFDTVIFTQNLAYAMPGTLKADVISANPSKPEILLKAGTLLWGVPTKAADEKPTWCTQPAAGVSPMCIGMGASGGVMSYYLFPVSADAAVEGARPAAAPQKVAAPEVEISNAVVDSTYRVTFAMKKSDKMEIERKYWRGSSVVVTQQLKLLSRHDMVFATTEGAALYVSYDAATEGFTAKRYASEAEAMASK